MQLSDERKVRETNDALNMHNFKLMNHPGKYLNEIDFKVFQGKCVCLTQFAFTFKAALDDAIFVHYMTKKTQIPSKVHFVKKER